MIIGPGDWITYNHGWTNFGCGQVIHVLGSTLRVRVYMGGSVYSGDHQIVPMGRVRKHAGLEEARDVYEENR